jgi:hydroxymethylpyrimidine pyrophosphatase-like HAD family hydrolase
MNKRYVLVDLDGTISDDRCRRERFPDQKPGISLALNYTDWENYFRGMVEDPFINRWIVNRNDGCKVIITTSRPERYRNETVAWLRKHNIKYSCLLMRRPYDYKTSPEVKAEMIRTIVSILNIAKCDIVAAYDDRADVIEMFRNEGIIAVHIAPPGS